MSDVKLKVPPDIIEGVRVALSSYLGHEPTDEQIGRGLAEMLVDIQTLGETPEKYARWLARVLGEDVTVPEE